MIYLNRIDDVAKLANIIKDYRKDELKIKLGAEHIEKWLNQFTPENQDVILAETVHIFESWYFDYSKIDDMLDSMVDYLCKKYEIKQTSQLFKIVSFINIQEDGASQSFLLSHLIDRIGEQYAVSVRTDITEEISHYVYLDDGLYTGKRARKDLADCLYSLHPNTDVDAFYIVAGTQGLQYVKGLAYNLAKELNISLKIQAWKLIYNNKSIDRVFHYNQLEESYETNQFCLWPLQSTNEKINAYYEHIKTLGDNYEKCAYRTSPWRNDKGIFTSAQNREIVETEFLIRGIEILGNINDNKGLYPLGFSLWPSFGFGSFCAFNMNISNSCPLVLWWGNLEKNGSVLDDWYPLLPRRTNAETEENHNALNWEDETEDTMTKDQYNMCPDCYCYFGIERDGGNGYCIDCAWRH